MYEFYNTVVEHVMVSATDISKDKPTAFVTESSTFSYVCKQHVYTLITPSG